MSDFFTQALQKLEQLRDSAPVYEPLVPREAPPSFIPRRINTYGQAAAITQRVPHDLDIRINFWSAADCYILLVKTPHVRRDTNVTHRHRWVSLDLTDEQLIDQLIEMADEVHASTTYST